MFSDRALASVPAEYAAVDPVRRGVFCCLSYADAVRMLPRCAQLRRAFDWVSDHYELQATVHLSYVVDGHKEPFDNA